MMSFGGRGVIWVGGVALRITLFRSHVVSIPAVRSVQMYFVIRTTKRVPSPRCAPAIQIIRQSGSAARHIAAKLDPTFPRLFAIARNCWLLKRPGQLRLSFAAALVGSEFQKPAWRNWQTRWTQNPVAARPCGFEPLRRQIL